MESRRCRSPFPRSSHEEHEEGMVADRAQGVEEEKLNSARKEAAAKSENLALKRQIAELESSLSPARRRRTRNSTPRAAAAGARKNP